MLEERVKQQFPALFITFVSVLIGLVFADLVSEARSRMALWPLNLATLRTWAQIFSMAASAFAAWVVYSHFGISRNHIPSFADSFSAVLVPTPLLIFNSFVGLPQIWPWFYFASVYLVICLGSSLWQLRLIHSELELRTFRDLHRPTGFVGIFYTGVPTFALAGWADQHGWLSAWMELSLAALPVLRQCCACIFFSLIGGMLLDRPPIKAPNTSTGTSLSDPFMWKYMTEYKLPRHVELGDRMPIAGRCRVPWC